MLFSKTKIYEVALSACLLTREVDNVDTDTTNEVKNLNLYYDIALSSTLQDLDLESTSSPIALQLIATLTDNAWTYVYKYPDNCVFLRRLESMVAVDNRSTHISKRVAIYNGVKGIFTNQEEAIAECIPSDVPLVSLSAMAGLAIGYKLALLTAPLLVGKGAKRLRENIMVDYMLAKSEAQRIDSLENFNYEDETVRSEFVAARLS